MLTHGSDCFGASFQPRVAFVVSRCDGVRTTRCCPLKVNDTTPFGRGKWAPQPNRNFQPVRARPLLRVAVRPDRVVNERAPNRTSAVRIAARCAGAVLVNLPVRTTFAPRIRCGFERQSSESRQQTEVGAQRAVRELDKFRRRVREGRAVKTTDRVRASFDHAQTRGCFWREEMGSVFVRSLRDQARRSKDRGQDRFEP